MSALPAELPVLLIMLGEALSPHELQDMSNGRPGPVELLQWDTNAAALIRVLRDLLRGPQARFSGLGLVPSSRPAP